MSEELIEPLPELIAGRYQPEKLLHRGRHRDLYVCADLCNPGRKVVVKCCRSMEVDTEARLVEEFRRLASLEHPGIPRAHELLRDPANESLCLVLEPARGRPLSEQGSHLNSTSWLQVLRRSLLVLEFLHQRGLAHLDIKPDHLFVEVDSSGEVTMVQLIDFDLAAALGTPLALRGTPPFIAPEWTTELSPVLPSLDLYSLGATFLSVLSADFDSPEPFWRMPRGRAPEIFAAVESRVGRDVGGFLLRMTSETCEFRPESAADIELLSVLPDPPGKVAIAADSLASLARPVLIGRDDALRHLASFRANLGPLKPRQFGNAPFALCLRGERGSGRSRLLDETAVECAIDGFRVFRLEGSGCESASAAGLAVEHFWNEFLTIYGRGEDKGTPGARRLDPDPPAPLEMGPAFLLAITDRIFEVAKSRSVVLLIDDAGDLDESSLKFIYYLARRMSAAAEVSPIRPLLALVLVVDSRLNVPELEDLIEDLRVDDHLKIVEVTALDAADTLRLGESLSRPRVLSPEAAAALTRWGNGLPGRVVELCREMRRHPANPGDEHERIGVAQIETAAAAVDSNSARTADLLPDSRHILECLVLHPFPLNFRDLQILCSTRADADTALLDLEWRRLIQRDQNGDWRPADAALRDAVIARLRPDDRSRRHGEIAAMLQGRRGLSGRADWTMVWHTILSDRVDQHWLAEAFQTATELASHGASEAALRLFETIADLPSGRRTHLEWMAAIQAVHLRWVRGETERALERLGSLRQPQTFSPVAELYAARLELAANRAPAAANRAATAARASGFDPSIAAELHILAAESFMQIRELPLALEHMQSAERLLRSLDRLPDLEWTPANRLSEFEAPPLPSPQKIGVVQAQFTKNYAELEMRRGQLHRALGLAFLTLKMENHLGNLQGFGAAHHLIAKVYMQAECADKAETHYKKAAKVLADVGDLSALAGVLNNLGILKRRARLWNDAVEFLRRSLKIYRELGDKAGEIRSHLNIANIYVSQRELAAAARSIDKCERLSRRLPPGSNRSTILNSRGIIARLRDQYDLAFGFFWEQRASHRRRGETESAVKAQLNAAEVLVCCGHWQRARRLAEVALRYVRRRHLEHEQVVALWLLAEIDFGLNRHAEALLELDQALAVSRTAKMGADILESNVRRLEVLTFAGDKVAARLVRRDLNETDQSDLDPDLQLSVDICDLHLVENDARPVARECVERLVAAHRLALQRRMPSVSFAAVAALARWYDQIGNPDRAVYFYSAALESLEQILRIIGQARSIHAFLDVPDVRRVLRDAGILIARICPESADESTRLPVEIQSSLDQLKRGFFDVERVLGSSGAHLRRTEQGIYRILEISQTLTSTAPMDELLTQVVDGVVDFTGAERGFIILEDRGAIAIRISRTMHREPINRPESEVSWRVIERVQSTLEPVILQNAMDEADFQGSESVMNLELRSIMCAPMIRSGRLIGMVYVDNRSRVGQFAEEDLELLHIFAAHIAIAIENSRLVQEFVRTEKMHLMGLMASSVAHDFNNLLTIIMGRAQLVRDVATERDQINHLVTVEKAARDGITLVRNLRDLTRNSALEELHPTLIRAVVDDVIDFTRTRREGEFLQTGRRIHIRNEVEPNAVVIGSAVRLREVFTNVILNAMAAMPSGGNITISSRIDRERIQIVVKDNGIGMTNAVRDRVFSPFFTTNDRDGSGLGMSIVYAILMRHGGSVRVESQVGLGTSVIIELPRSFEIPAPENGIAVPVDVSRHTGRRLLVVDDDDGVRLLLRDVLARSGYSVEVAASGVEALEYLSGDEFPFSLVLTDLGMVPVSGWDLARSIRERFPEVPIILVTGWGAELAPDQVRSSIVDMVLAKPFENTVLIQSIENILSRAAPPAERPGT